MLSPDNLTDLVQRLDITARLTEHPNGLCSTSLSPNEARLILTFLAPLAYTERFKADAAGRDRPLYERLLAMSQNASGYHNVMITPDEAQLLLAFVGPGSPIEMPDKTIYRYREGVHGEHCIDIGSVGFQRAGTVARAATKEDAEAIIRELTARVARAARC